MLVTVEWCRGLLGVQTTAHDAYIEMMISAAQERISAYLGQPIERVERTHSGLCTASVISEYGIVILPASINVELASVYSGGDDITALSRIERDCMVAVPTDYIGLMVDVTYQSGWTSTDVPADVQYAIAQLVQHYYTRTELSSSNYAGLQSTSSSDAGVITHSRTIDRDYEQSILSRLERWRLRP